MKNLLYSLISKCIGLLILTFVAFVWVLYAWKQLVNRVFSKRTKPQVTISKQQQVDIKVKQPMVLTKEENLSQEQKNML
ncbi:hypothetical protein Q0590_21875 [Rhodocytophaga aerolata]|uniref:DUF4834 family protein n=1 Tax=Rhodocytophaga aerolata TaxID=455078 RepID=A0ABT8RA37_9BACT|nr:hypothetical protein [Rhodocytophaga aerolata]MDO1448942.1 hypothetical protein [Rhodocytophaga aerolata]